MKSLNYAGGCHLGPLGRCRFCGKTIYEEWGPSNYHLLRTSEGKRHSKRGCNILDPIWFCWRVWEIIEEEDEVEEE